MAERSVGLIERLVTPRGVLAAFVLLFLIGLLALPWATAEDRSPPLSSYGTADDGARGLYDVLARLGFNTERRLRPFRDTLDARAVHLVLEPGVPLTAGEVHRLLEAVRAGASLLLVLPVQQEGLADSVGVGTFAAVAGRADSTRTLRETLDDARVRLVLRPPENRRTSSDIYRRAPKTVFDSMRTRRGVYPVAAGFPLGRGRIVVAADGAAFANEAVRMGERGVQAVRIVEWLLDGDAARPIVFDEYHHGFGTHADVLGFLARSLIGTAAGRVLLVLGCAGLLLLLALGVRPIRPQPQRRIQRRSPLEHVAALAHAYAAVPATSRAARLLVRGLHRRHAGVRGRASEADWLRAVAARAPHVAPDVERVLAAMKGGAAATDAELTSAILRIEDAIAS